MTEHKETQEETRERLEKERHAPEGKIWVCMACGKTSPDRFGNDPATHHGWDESCFMHAELHDISDLIGYPGMVVGIKEEEKK